MPVAEGLSRAALAQLDSDSRRDAGAVRSESGVPGPGNSQADRPEWSLVFISYDKELRVDDA